MMIGAIAGVVAGLLAAYIVIQRSEHENVLPNMTPADGVKIGLGVLGVLRLVSDLGARD